MSTPDRARGMVDAAWMAAFLRDVAIIVALVVWIIDNV